MIAKLGGFITLSMHIKGLKWNIVVWELTVHWLTVQRAMQPTGLSACKEPWRQSLKTMIYIYTNRNRLRSFTASSTSRRHMKCHPSLEDIGHSCIFQVHFVDNISLKLHQTIRLTWGRPAGNPWGCRQGLSCGPRALAQPPLPLHSGYNSSQSCWASPLPPLAAASYFFPRGAGAADGAERGQSRSMHGWSHSCGFTIQGVPGNEHIAAEGEGESHLWAHTLQQGRGGTVLTHLHHGKVGARPCTVGKKRGGVSMSDSLHVHGWPATWLVQTPGA